MRTSISDFGLRIWDFRGDARRRGGISLLEVLISMFVLLFGLMGVAAIFPVGNHYATRGEQYDRGTALADAALAELKGRVARSSEGQHLSMLNPKTWFYAPDSTGMLPPAYGEDRDALELIDVYGGLSQRNRFARPPGASLAGPGQIFVLDPLGAAAGFEAGAYDIDLFPFADLTSGSSQGPAFSTLDWTSGSGWNSPEWENPLPALDPANRGSRWPVRRMTFEQARRVPMKGSVAEKVFRLRDDLAVELPTESDRPAIQRWSTIDPEGDADDDDNLGATDNVPLARQFVGNYSWLATVVPTSADYDPSIDPNFPELQPSDSWQALQPSDSRYGTYPYDVTVVVFYKRDPVPSAESERMITAALNPGNELAFYAANDDVDAVDAALKEIRPGQWIALCGVHPTSGQVLLKWYKLLSLGGDDATEEGSRPWSGNGGNQDYAVRRAMIEGPEWPIVDRDNSGGIDVNDYPTDLRAILLPGAIGATTEQMQIDVEGAY